ncbi:MAG: alkaline phosphatase family protein [Anaerolineae bacterium]|nr:alkaline phosphatase family protein [Anaerolineae bacterium]
MRVVFVMIDGLRPDAIDRADTPTLHSIMARGSYTLAGQSVMPSITLPCHTSIFHSVPPTRHGITDNNWRPMARPVIGLLEAASDADKRSAFFYNWEELRDLSRPGSLDYSYMVKAAYQIDYGDRLVAEAAARDLATYDFSFVYLGTVDSAGHFFGWMSDGYLEQVRRVDAELAKVVAALPEDTVLIVHSDHGGHDRFHGTDLPEDMTIPWMIAGPGIRAGYTIEREVTLLDTAPTIARLLELKVPADWEGTCVDEVFE